jgi:cell division inhibitor SulA
MSAALDTLLHNAAVWRGSEHSRAESESIPSGFDAFDNALGGWPLGALIELITQREGIGELSVLLPALARLSKDERWIALVNPPYIPYAPALFHAGIDLAKIVVIRAPGATDVLWSMEQALRSGTCSAVLGWPAAMTEQAIRRLQLATETGRALGAYFTQPGAIARPSPVPCRLQIGGSIDDIRIEVLKRRGGSLTSPLNLGPVNTTLDGHRQCCGCV